MKILMIAEAFPYPPTTGDRIRVFNLLKQLAQSHEIYLTGFLPTEADKQYIPEIKQYCREVHTVTARRISKWRHLPGVLKAVLTGQPLDAKFVFCREMQDIIQDLLKRIPIDLIQIEHSFMAEYIRVIPKGYPAKTVLAFENIGYVQYKRFFQTEKRFFKKIRNLLNWLAMETWEARMAGLFDRCLTVSDVDRELLLRKNPKLNVSLAPNGVDTQAFSPLPAAPGNNLLFIGKLSYHPNIDAALYFAREIFPRIRARIAGATLTIIGSNPPAEVEALAGLDNIEVKGFVDDVMPHYQKSRLSIVPLRSGSGTRLKILESMALGRPIVSTSIGCEGIAVQAGVHICLADDAQTFADECVRMLSDPAAWNSMARKGRELVEENYSWEKIGKQLGMDYEAMVKSGGKR